MRARAAFLLPLLLGCTSAVRAPDLGGLYSRSARWHHERRNPVIVIPGILGSKLRDAETGRVVWGAFSGDYANPGSADGARLLALPMREGAALDELTDGVRSDGALDRVRLKLLGITIEAAAYANILATLGVGGYRDSLLARAGAVDYGTDHFTCFQFDYDWRRDLVENAERFHAWLAQTAASVRAERQKRFDSDEEVRFDVVAHSMGGLLARYYLMYGPTDLPAEGAARAPDWAGAGRIERAILIGTPNAGSIRALSELVHGSDLGPVLPTYPPAILGTMPAVYQLLPRPRHGPLRDGRGAAVDLLDPALWERRGWGLLDPSQDRVLEWLLPEAGTAADRRRIARDHVGKCLARARRFHEAIDVPARPPEGTALYLVAGDAEPTPAVASLEEVAFTEWAPGDGTVLRTSAVMDERVGGAWRPSVVTPIAWRQTLFLFTDHLGLTRDPAFTDNVLYLLLEDPR